MTAVPTDARFTPEQRQTLERIEAAPAAPESFDPIAALRRVEALADELEAWRENALRFAEHSEPGSTAGAMAHSRALVYERALTGIRTALTSALAEEEGL